MAQKRWVLVNDREPYKKQFSVYAEPTRAFHVAEKDRVRIEQARRQAPGWDGCRDRHDGRDDLPQELQWVHPSQRAAHRAIFSKASHAVKSVG